MLLLETSEELPPAEEVFRMLRKRRRARPAQFPAVVVGTAKATSLERRVPPAERERHRDEQRAAVLRALDTYAPEAVAVFGVDLGHTDPQYVLPYGGTITIDGPARRVTMQY